jgi:hypothetical protein
MAVNPAPYNPQFEVEFTPDGDSTSMGMFKHIQEIIRIYSLLNGLDIGKMDAEEFQNWVRDVFNAHVDVFNTHVNAVEPHPNLVIDMSKITGQLPASRVGQAGDVNLSNAFIDWARVTSKPSTFPPGAHSHGAGDLPIATTEGRGIVELATTEEATAGTDTIRAVTPAHLKALRDAIMSSVSSACGAYYGCSGHATTPPCSECDRGQGCQGDM